jgi:hypothetical protein
MPLSHWPWYVPENKPQRAVATTPHNSSDLTESEVPWSRGCLPRLKNVVLVCPSWEYWYRTQRGLLYIRKIRSPVNWQKAERIFCGFLYVFLTCADITLKYAMSELSRYRDGLHDARQESIPGRGKRCCPARQHLYRLWDTYPIGTVDSFPAAKAAETWCLLLISEVKNCGAISPACHMSHDAVLNYVNKDRTLTFYLFTADSKIDQVSRACKTCYACGSDEHIVAHRLLLSCDSE